MAMVSFLMLKTVCTFVPLQLHNISVYFPIGIKYAPQRLFLLFNKHRHENAIAILMQKVCRVSFIAVCWRNKGTFTKIAWQRDSLIWTVGAGHGSLCSNSKNWLLTAEYWMRIKGENVNNHDNVWKKGLIKY